MPMNVRDQLLLAAEAGHELRVVKRGPWPEHGDPNPKWYVSCSCGWEARAVRSKVAMNGTLAWHLSAAVADALEARSDARAASRRRLGDQAGGSRVAGAPGAV